MSYDLGLHLPFISNVRSFQKKVRSLDKDFHLVMIAEKFDQSLVLLKNLICAAFDDMASKVQREAHSQKPHLSGESKAILKDVLSYEVRLYEYFLQKFKSKLSKLGVRGLLDKNRLNLAKRKMTKRCDDYEEKSLFDKCRIEMKGEDVCADCLRRMPFHHLNCLALNSDEGRLMHYVGCLQTDRRRMRRRRRKTLIGK